MSDSKEKPTKEQQTEAIKLEINRMYRAVEANLAGFSKRSGQLQMIRAITAAVSNSDDADRFEDGRHIAIVEGRTGVGKTIGYLIPAIAAAKILDKRLVISTGTVSLQEQLFDRDIPAMLKAIGSKASFAMAKGRRRYVCKNRLNRLSGDANQDNMFEDGGSWDRPPQEAEMKLLGRLAQALHKKQWTGDRDKLEEKISDVLWYKLTTDSAGCAKKHCPDYHDCSMYVARREVKDADIIVANHDLVLSCLSNTDNKILPDPEETLWIFDEAHHLPETAIGHFQESHALKAPLKWLDKISAIAARSASISGVPAPASIGERAENVAEALREVYSTLASGNLVSLDKRQFRFGAGVIGEALTAVGLHLFDSAVELEAALTSITESLTGAAEKMPEKAPMITHMLSEVGTLFERVQSIAATWELMLEVPATEKSPPNAKWLTLMEGNSGDILVTASPISAARILKKNLWSCAGAVALASATITTLGNFHFFRRKSGLLGLNGVIEAQVESPFDFERQGEIVIPMMKSDPTNAEAHTAELGKLLALGLQSETNGGALTLFASRKQMEAVYADLSPALRDRVLMQGQIAKSALILEHKRRVDAGIASIIFGLQSFGEGVDLPGRYCTQVAIAKLPFSPPDNPVDEATAEYVESRGGNPFMELALPKASLILTQWVGRLIRTVDDHGRVLIFDRRLFTKRYGPQLLDSLPPFSRRLRQELAA